MREKFDQTKLALNLVYEKFKDKVDKGGEPYCGHLVRVARNADKAMNDISELYNEDADPKYYIVGVLHDIIEDTDVTKDKLLEMGFDDDIVEAVDCISRRKNESYYDFIIRIKKNEIATVVKIFDLEDNMDVRRLKKFGDEEMKRERKYWYSWMYLNEKISEDELWRNIG